LGFTRGRVTSLVDIVIDWFPPVIHTKYASIMTGDLDKELSNHSNTSGLS
jgi:hypothetical protein